MQPFPVPDPRPVVTSTVRGFQGRYDYSESPELETVTEFILDRLVQPREVWVRVSEEDPTRFVAEVGVTGRVLGDYLRLVENRSRLDEVSEERLIAYLPEDLLKLDQLWDCNFYILKIC